MPDEHQDSRRRLRHRPGTRRRKQRDARAARDAAALTYLTGAGALDIAEILGLTSDGPPMKPSGHAPRHRLTASAETREANKQREDAP